MSNEVSDFYEGAQILVTGGTGFIGKVLIQKLLRSCRNIHIYLLVREKKNLPAMERIKKIFEDPLFARLKGDVPHFLANVTVLEGDMSCKSLKLSSEVTHMLKSNINFVFHCAADLNLGQEQSITKAVDTNVRGTYELLELCKDMQGLKVFMLVSSVYAVTTVDIEERFYENNISPKFIMSLCDELDESMINVLKPKLLGLHRNAYTFTKALSENAAYEFRNKIPIGIFRPSIVMSTYKDPIPGWTDNLYGALGIMFSVLLGIMRVANIKLSSAAEVVPVDFCVNALICSAWDVSRQWKKNKELVYNYANYSHMLTWKIVKKLFLTNQKYAFNNAIWAPFLITCESKLLYKILNYILHIIPGFACDCLLLLLNKKRRFHKTYRNLAKFHDVVSDYTFHKWNITCDNSISVWTQMSESARNVFLFDLNLIDQNFYFENVTYGLKKYFLKEDVTDKERDERSLFRLYLIHRTAICLLVVLFALLCYFVYLKSTF